MTLHLKTGVVWLLTISLAVAGSLAEQAHPRLWFTKAMEPAVRQRIAKDPLAASLQISLVAEADKILTSRTCRYEIPDGKRLLAESRLALRQIMVSAWVWRMKGDENYRLRTISEMEAACGLKDWNPSHFLDTAELATAVATGYDWLYPTLTPAQRTMCEQALIEKALKPAQKIYDKNSGWSNPGNNWSQVCGGGISVAAAAVAEIDSTLAESLFERGSELVQQCGKFYQPDGMYPEGTSYWQYGTNYHVMFLAASATVGRPVKDDPILEKAGEAMMHLTSPSRLPFNFADGNASTEAPSPAQCWLAAHFKSATQARHIRSIFAQQPGGDTKKKINGNGAPLALLWLPESPPDGPQPYAAVFHGEQAIALFRNGWKADCAFLGIKGGTPAASHGHMDVGSFVYDAHGIRWITDMGSENYNLPGYFGNQRWNYYRLQNRSHNTLEINGALQNKRAKPCPLTSSSITGDVFDAAFDLSDAYAGAAEKVTRRARFDRKSGIARIDDEIAAPAGPVVWRAFTEAKPEIRGDDVILKKGGQQITLHKVSPEGTWSLASAKPPTDKENQNKGVTAIVLTAQAAEKVTLSVEIRP